MPSEHLLTSSCPEPSRNHQFDPVDSNIPLPGQQMVEDNLWCHVNQKQKTTCLLRLWLTPQSFLLVDELFILSFEGDSRILK